MARFDMRPNINSLIKILRYLADEIEKENKIPDQMSISHLPAEMPTRGFYKEKGISIDVDIREKKGRPMMDSIYQIVRDECEGK